MIEDARHQGLHIARKHTRDIGNRFALAQTDLVRREVERIATAVTHRHVERDACPQAGLLEDHAKHFAFEIRLVAFLEIFFFQFDGKVEQVLHFPRG